MNFELKYYKYMNKINNLSESIQTCKMDYQRIVFLDNDECLGYFDLLNGVYVNFIVDIVKSEIEYEKMIQMKELMIECFVELLKIGYARPYLDTFFVKLHELKQNQKIDKIVMFTSAKRVSADSELFKCFQYDPMNIKNLVGTYKKLCNWVTDIRRIFSLFSGVDVYDHDISGVDDLGEKSVIYGATTKTLTKALKHIGVPESEFKNIKIIFIDDRIENVKIDGNLVQENVLLIKIPQYNILIDNEKIKQIIDLCNEKLNSFVGDSLYVYDSFKNLCDRELKFDKIRLSNVSNPNNDSYLKLYLNIIELHMDRPIQNNNLGSTENNGSQKMMDLRNKLKLFISRS